jgi:hypothetical protein
MNKTLGLRDATFASAAWQEFTGPPSRLANRVEIKTVFMRTDSNNNARQLAIHYAATSELAKIWIPLAAPLALLLTACFDLA